jgi:hypothetical protein
MGFDFDAHKELSGCSTNSIELSIRQATIKANQYQCNYKVCLVSGNVMVLPELSAKARNDIQEVIYHTSHGYSFPEQKRG